MRVRPGASRDKVVQEPEGLKIYVTAIAEKGKANAAVQKLLAKHLGLAPSRLSLIKGDKGREKTFAILS